MPFEDVLLQQQRKMVFDHRHWLHQVYLYICLTFLLNSVIGPLIKNVLNFIHRCFLPLSVWYHWWELQLFLCCSDSQRSGVDFPLYCLVWSNHPHLQIQNEDLHISRVQIRKYQDLRLSRQSAIMYIHLAFFFID